MKKKTYAVILLLILGGIIMYERVNWQNSPSTATPVSADNLNKMDKGIADIDSQLAETVKKVNGKLPDVNGNVEINVPNPDLSPYATKNEVNTLIGDITDGTPLFASDVAGMTDTTRLYVNTTDGLIYVYNGTEFISTGVQYQSTGIAESSITPDTLSALVVDTITSKQSLKLQYGKNLFNKDDVFIDSYIISNGALASTTGQTTSNYIEVKPNTQVSISRMRWMAEYDSFKQFIPGTRKGGTGAALQTTITTNANTKFIRVTTANTLVSPLQVEIGSSNTIFEPYKTPVLLSDAGNPLSISKVENPEIDFRVEVGGVNRFDKNAITIGTLTSAGNIYPDSTDSWIVSDFIPVSALTSVAINNARTVAEYDRHKGFIAETYVIINPTGSRIFTTHKDTKYIRVGTPASNKDTLQVEYGTELSPYEEAYYSVFYGSNKVYDLISEEINMEKNLLELSEYEKYVDREKYQIYQAKDPNKIVWAIHNNIAVKSTGTTVGSVIEISTTGINGAYDKSVIFNSTNFPNLTGRIEQIIILPFTRNLGSNQTGKDYRIVVITNDGRMYHNYPSRALDSDGVEISGDIIKFEESVIWDLPERKYPSSNPVASGVERYMPGLPADRYKYYPVLNTDVNYVDTYGNGGFGKSITKDGITFPRFYQPGRGWQNNSLGFMGGFEPDSKISLIGTYKSNTEDAVRICIFATDDGGRSWYVKYEFTTQKSINSTPIDTSAITENYIANTLAISKRNLVLPNSEVKEPATKFSWDTDVIVSSISKGTSTVMTTSTEHKLSTGDIIAFKTNTGISGFDWLVNDGISDISGGNGVLFGVKVLTPTTFEIYEYVSSAHNNIPCRHIHHINRVKDGWIFGAGEEYPNGFIFYMQMLAADNFQKKLAHQDYPTYRLTSSDTSLQRTLGVTMLDDENSTVIAALDTAAIVRENVEVPLGRTDVFYRNSTGIYKGSLADIDNINNYKVMYEAKEPAYFFKEKAGAYIFVGQRGEFAISFDKGSTWEVENIQRSAQHFRGESKKIIVIDDFIIAIK